MGVRGAIYGPPNIPVCGACTPVQLLLLEGLEGYSYYSLGTRIKGTAIHSMDTLSAEDGTRGYWYTTNTPYRHHRAIIDGLSVYLQQGYWRMSIYGSLCLGVRLGAFGGAFGGA